MNGMPWVLQFSYRPERSSAPFFISLSFPESFVPSFLLTAWVQSLYHQNILLPYSISIAFSSRAVIGYVFRFTLCVCSLDSIYYYITFSSDEVKMYDLSVFWSSFSVVLQ